MFSSVKEMSDAVKPWATVLSDRVSVTSAAALKDEIVGTEARRGSSQCPATLAEAVRRAGEQHRAEFLVDRVHPEAALVEMVGREHLHG